MPRSNAILARCSLALSSVMLCGAAIADAQPARHYAATSPDGNTQIGVDVGDQTTYTVTHRGRVILGPSPISMTLTGDRVLGRGARVTGTRMRRADEVLHPVVSHKNAAVRDHYAEVRIDFRGSYALEARAYDDGVAYRWVTDLPDSLTVVSEEATFRFGANHEAIVGLDSTFMTHQEAWFIRTRLDSLRAPRMGLLPFLVAVDSGPKVAITETGLEDYPGMYLTGSGSSTLVGLFPQFALAEELEAMRGRGGPPPAPVAGAPGAGAPSAGAPGAAAPGAGGPPGGGFGGGNGSASPSVVGGFGAPMPVARAGGGFGGPPGGGGGGAPGAVRRSDRNVIVTQRAPYIARTIGRRSFPWRIAMVADRDADLVASDLVYKLGPAQRLTDVSWIRPGKVSWDWWNATNLRGVPFESGVNTETYKYFIDFASRHGIPYVMLDEGWYQLGDLLKLREGLDMAALSQYAQSKNVGLILWTVWKTLDDQMGPALDQFQKWGVKGIKVDFMQRDDQEIVNFYWRTAQEAAKRHLMVDFHGAHKPAGLDRAWPNVMTFEGVRGLEQDKFGTQLTPEHDVIIPFTRMLAGPMDYTPGAMNNATPRQYRTVSDRPMSQGTRAHQLAMYVVYESPLQMLADTPTEYEREAESLEFLSAVPTVWDETRVLDARVADYILVARRRGTEWYVGAMGDGEARTLSLDLSFLGDGTFTMDAWQDGPNATRDARDYLKTSRSVSRTGKIELHLAPGGGFAARIRPGA